MKHLLLATLIFASAALADTPAAISADYRKQVVQAVARLNQSLEKAATPLITQLVSSGDTSGAEELTKQLKAKIAGEPVATPQSSAALLFAQFDQARAKAVEPIQKASIARIDGMLKMPGGPKLETVTELGKVRAEIEAGKAIDFPAIPVEWTYHRSPTNSASESDVFFQPGGVFLMVNRDGEKKFGKWKPGKEANTLIIDYPITNSVWTVLIEGDLATVDRPDLKDKRYFKVKK